MVLLNSIMRCVRDLPILSVGGGFWRAGNSGVGLGSHKRWIECSFHPNHCRTHRATRTANSEWNRRQDKRFKGKYLFLVFGKVTYVQLNEGYTHDKSSWTFADDLSVPACSVAVDPLCPLSQMQRCFGFFCASLIFCATFSETVGLVIAVNC